MKGVGKSLYDYMRRLDPDDEDRHTKIFPLEKEEFHKVVSKILAEKLKLAQNTLLLQLSNDQPLTEQKSKTNGATPFKPNLNKHSIKLASKKRRDPYFGYNAKSYKTVGVLAVGTV